VFQLKKKTMKKSVVLLALLTSHIFISCDKSDAPAPPMIDVKDFEITMSENPVAGFVIGTLDAKTDKGTLTFKLLSESVAGAFEVEEKTGKLKVKTSSKFDYEKNKNLSAKVLAENMEVKKEISVNVNLTNADYKIGFFDPAKFSTPTSIGLNQWVGTRVFVSSEDQGKLLKSLNVNAPNTGGQVKMYLYSDTNGKPDFLIFSASGVINKEGLNEFPLMGENYLGGSGFYWIVIKSESSQNVIYYQPDTNPLVPLAIWISADFPQLNDWSVNNDAQIGLSMTIDQ
jgi:hypothetical protein